MTPGGRLFFDISYTRTQHGNMGITRTVRRLLEEFERARPGGRECTPVAFNRRGFRLIPPARAAASEQSLAPGVQSAGARFFRWVTGDFFRRAVIVSTMLIPWRVLRHAWSVTSSWTFDSLSRGNPAVSFRPGDVLFLCDASWNYPVWRAARLARRQGAKVVLLMYDLIPLRHPQFCFPLVPYIFRLWLHEMLGCADAVICISKATEDDLRAYARETRVSLPPAGHFRLGSDSVRTLAAFGDIREQLKAFMNAAHPCFVAIGSFEPKKNYGFLLDVFERIWSRGEAARLLIIGRETPECAELLRRVRAHPEQGSKLLTLFDASDAEVGHAYAHGRALVFPSCAEGFGLPLVEARARGNVVIASGLPVFSELADEGVYLYPQGSHEALTDLLLQHARTDLRANVPPMPPFLWRDSAREAVEAMDRLLRAAPVAA